MTFYAIILLSLAATFGLSMVFIGARFQRSSLKLAMGHATFALAGLAFLGTQIYQGPINKYNNGAALLLALALIGGGMLFALREKDKPPAMMLVLMHAIMAIAGLSVLILGQL